MAKCNGAAVEMSVTQAIAPDHVRPGLAHQVDERDLPPGGPLRLLAPPQARVAPRGYHGRPGGIHRELGAQLLDLAADRIVASVDALLDCVRRWAVSQARMRS